jgi:hypothetical protein
MSEYDNFQVLLDDPATKPSLGFEEYARSFAGIIRHSRAQFAIGIFGDWGSGKTTLMHAIERELQADSHIIPVWFSAWKYEREEHLIVPLLDTLRKSLALWSTEHETGRRAGFARRAASTVGSTARSISRGLKLTGSVPLVGVGASLDVGAILDQGADPNAPASFYAASFDAMSEALEQYLKKSRRVVVFVDDLDRCLPDHALQVVEATKLFFDQEGFVFVVGLDDAVIRRAIEDRYRGESQVPNEAPAAGNGARPEDFTGGEYLKKIFQVPFGLPPVSPTQLTAFFDETVATSGLPRPQKSNLRRRIRPHLRYTARLGSVNPRELKRLINAYTLQVKMLSAKPPPFELDEDVVLAIQVMNFRHDWRRLYELLAADPAAFQAALAEAAAPGASPDRFWISSEPLPQDFIRYVQGPASPLLGHSLDPYITSAELSISTDRGLLDMQSSIAELIRMLGGIEGSDQLTSEVASELTGRVQELQFEARQRSRKSQAAREASELSKEIQTDVRKRLGQVSEELPSAWIPDVVARLQRLDGLVGEMRGDAAVGAASLGP